MWGRAIAAGNLGFMRSSESRGHVRNDSVPDNPNKNVPNNGSGAHLVKMTEKSLRRRKLQNPPTELYVFDLIRRLKSATD